MWSKIKDFFSDHLMPFLWVIAFLLILFFIQASDNDSIRKEAYEEAQYEYEQEIDKQYGYGYEDGYSDGYRDGYEDGLKHK